MYLFIKEILIFFGFTLKKWEKTRCPLDTLLDLPTGTQVGKGAVQLPPSKHVNVIFFSRELSIRKPSSHVYMAVSLYVDADIINDPLTTDGGVPQSK